MTPKIILVVLAAVTFSACGGSSGGGATEIPTETPTETVRLTISDSRFETRELRVAAGTTVVFENTDPFAHTVTSTDGSMMTFGSDDLRQGETFEVTFDEPGEYPYFCVIHPTMRATVIVE